MVKPTMSIWLQVLSVSVDMLCWLKLPLGDVAFDADDPHSHRCLLRDRYLISFSMHSFSGKAKTNNDDSVVMGQLWGILPIEVIILEELKLGFNRHIKEKFCEKFPIYKSNFILLLLIKLEDFSLLNINCPNWKAWINLVHSTISAARRGNDINAFLVYFWCCWPGSRGCALYMCLAVATRTETIEDSVIYLCHRVCCYLVGDCYFRDEFLAAII